MCVKAFSCFRRNAVIDQVSIGEKPGDALYSIIASWNVVVQTYEKYLNLASFCFISAI